MANDTGNDSSAFPTHWEWKLCKIDLPPEAAGTAPRSGTFRSLSGPWPPRLPLSVTFTYRGGPQCWWEIKARGITVRRPGYLAMHDVMREIMGMK